MVVGVLEVEVEVPCWDHFQRAFERGGGGAKERGRKKTKTSSRKHR